MNVLTGPMFNELCGKVAIRVTPYPDVSIMHNSNSTAVVPIFLLWSRPHLLLEVNSLQCRLALLGSLGSSAPPRLLSFIFVAALTWMCDVQPVPPCVRHVYRDCVNRWTQVPAAREGSRPR